MSRCDDCGVCVSGLYVEDPDELLIRSDCFFYLGSFKRPGLPLRNIKRSGSATHTDTHTQTDHTSTFPASLNGVGRLQDFSQDVLQLSKHIHTHTLNILM